MLYDMHGQPPYGVPTPGSGPSTLTNLASMPGYFVLAWFLYTKFTPPRRCTGSTLRIDSSTLTMRMMPRRPPAQPPRCIG